jgi:glutamine amidotransferase
MCRLFGLSAGERRVRATFWLLDAPDSLDRQSHQNPDGCGVAGFDPAGNPDIYKAPVAAWDDPDFDAAARDLISTTFVGHVRHASTGGRTYANTHPFTYDGVVFAHNGALAGLDRIEAELGEYRQVLHGETDSERLFALVLKDAAAHEGDLGAGITSAVTWLAAEVPVLSLNMVVITPTDLWALRYPSADELYVLDRQAGGHHGDHQLHGVGQHGGIRVRANDLRDQRAVVVASERIDEHPGWQLLAPGELVHVDRRLHINRRVIIDRPPAHPLYPPS